MELKSRVGTALLVGGRGTATDQKRGSSRGLLQAGSAWPGLGECFTVTDFS